MSEANDTPTRNHWDDLATREKATLAFVRYLREHPEEVQKCKENGEYAKKKFADGYFYLEGERQNDPENPLRPIPMETVFRIYDFAPPPPRDKLVTLVLPPVKKPLKEMTEQEIAALNTPGGEAKATDIWLCTWPIWRTFDPPSS